MVDNQLEAWRLRMNSFWFKYFKSDKSILQIFSFKFKIFFAIIYSCTFTFLLAGITEATFTDFKSVWNRPNQPLSLIVYQWFYIFETNQILQAHPTDARTIKYILSLDQNPQSGQFFLFLDQNVPSNLIKLLTNPN